MEQTAQWSETGDFRTLENFSVVPGNEPAFRFYPPPCYLYILKTLKAIFPQAPLETIAIWWGIFIGTAFVALVYWIAHLTFASSRTALAVAFLASIHPWCAENAPMPMRDTTFLFLQTLVLALGLFAWRRRRWRVMGIAGFLAPLVFLCRFEGIMLALFFFGALGLSAALQRTRFSLQSLTAFLVGTGAGLLFWTWLMGIPWEFYTIYFSKYVYLRYATP